MHRVKIALLALVFFSINFVQAQIIKLLLDLKDRMGLTLLFITHDLSLVKVISDRIYVMYLGKIVEFADAKELYNNPKHPYTRALLSASPMPDPNHLRNVITLSGDVPSPINPPPGCRFHTRCPVKKEICSKREPEFLEKSIGHFAACFFA